MASPNKLSSHDKRDLDKFTKYLVYKCIQIIVQSRLGERVKTQSRPFSTGSDWFNLAIKDLPEVLAETKKVVSAGSFALGQHVCVEISLKTTEGESMILETWCLHMTEQKDPYARIFYTVYNRMSLMLKSLFCVTRATPAYRLSRKQGPDTYVLCYRIYNSEPETNLLGSGHETKSVGKVPTPLGTINLAVTFRTKMLISPYSSKELVEDLKDDHFKSDSTPSGGHALRKPCCLLNREARPAVTEEGFTLGESEFSASSFSTSPPDQCDYYTQYPAPSPRDGHALPHQRENPEAESNAKSNCDLGPKVIKSNNPTNGVNGFHSENGTNGININEDKINFEQISGFVSDGESGEEPDGPTGQQDSTEIPFVQLVKNISKMDIDKNANKTNGHDWKTAACENGLHGFADANGQSPGVSKAPSAVERLRNASGESSASSRASAAEDYVMIDMKSALTGMDENPELGQFYREFQEAPALTMFNHSEAPATKGSSRTQHASPQRPSPAQLLNSITDQLLQFEAQGQEFDDFVNSLSTQEV